MFYFSIFKQIINLIYPPVCGFCNQINNEFLCKKCEQKLEQEKIATIINYKNDPVFFDEQFYLFKYKKDIREYIINYKFNEKSYLYKSFTEVFVRESRFINKFIKNYDIIIPVPIHKKRYKTRGYNQSELIAKDIAKSCHIEYNKNILIKQNNIVAQSSLDDKLDRIKNIKNAFSKGTDIELVKNKKIAIFDDVFTTGATANECAKVLKENGAVVVGVFTIAKS
ncbi:MAG: ComF family protein [Clostridia bacterium]|nr:ComF family protein [Clostridia bacterium]